MKMASFVGQDIDAERGGHVPRGRFDSDPQPSPRTPIALYRPPASGGGGGVVLLPTETLSGACNYVLNLQIDCSYNTDEPGTLCVNVSAVSTTPTASATPSASGTPSRTPTSTKTAPVTPSTTAAATVTPPVTKTPTGTPTPTPTVGATQVCVFGQVDVDAVAACPSGSVITTVLFAR